MCGRRAHTCATAISKWKRTRQRVEHLGDVGKMNNALPKRDFCCETSAGECEEVGRESGVERHGAR